MNLGVIKALVAKDFSLFFRNRFYTLITILGIVFYLIIYFIMPSSVDEELKIGLYAPVLPPVFTQIQQEEGLWFEVLDSDEALKEAITDGVYVAGVALPADIMEKFASGQKPQITLYFPSDAPDEVKDAVETMVRELAYLQTGQTLAIEVSAKILGPDMRGEQIPIRDRLRLLLAIMLIMFEMMGLAKRVPLTIKNDSFSNMLVTPMRVRDLFAAKLIMGVSLAFIQGVLFLAIVGGLNTQPLIILTALFLGSMMFTGSGFLIASLSKDMMSSMGWGLILLLIYSIPAFGIMFPGTITDWAKAIPSYYLADTIHQASNFSAGWGDTWLNLLILLGFNLVIIWGGIMALRRKFQ